MKIPSFETDRLYLRGIELQDVPSYEKYFLDYEVIRYLSNRVPWPYPENGVEDFIKDYILPNQGKDHWMWGIFLKENKSEMIGGVELWRNGTPENRGFWLGKKFWNQGIMTEATKVITAHAFQDLGFESLTFANAVGNIRSRRVKEKSGAKLIGIEPAQFVDPQFTSHELWKLTKKDWCQQDF